MPSRDRTALLHGRHTSLDRLHALEVREDVFVRGPSEKPAVLIHCQHVLNGLLRLHKKTPHLLAAVVMGSAVWTAKELLFDKQLVLNELSKAVTNGHAIVLHAYLMLKEDEGSDEVRERYVELTKTYNLCYSRQAADTEAEHCWPPRVTQVLESAFMSKGHMRQCLNAEASKGDPARTWRAKRYGESLEARVADATARGAILPAVRAQLLRCCLTDDHERSALVVLARLLTSSAARLEELSALNRVIYGVLECTQTDENRQKVNNPVLTAMFDRYRAATLEYLTSDACCNFEAVRYAVKGAFFSVFSSLRQQGVLTRESQLVLATVDDYMYAVQLAASHQALQAAYLESAASESARGAPAARPKSRQARPRQGVPLRPPRPPRPPRRERHTPCSEARRCTPRALRRGAPRRLREGSLEGC